MIPSVSGDGGVGLDLRLLERMLSLGDSELRVALIAQLQEDLGRLARGLTAHDPDLVSRSAHELKGLAATIGAHGLAASAAHLERVAAGTTESARAALALGIGQQIAALCTELRARSEFPAE